MSRILVIPLAAALLAACAGAQPEAASPSPSGPQQAAPTQRGEASYYADHFAGRRTASGERFDPESDTAAHRTLAIGTVAEVTNLETGRSERVTIRDRGPFVRGRVVDVSPRVAEDLGMNDDGTAPVEVRPIAVPGRR